MSASARNATTLIKHMHLRIMLMAAATVLLTSILAGLAAVLPYYQSSRSNLENSLQMATEAHADALHHKLVRYQDIARQFTSRTEIRRQLEAYTRGDVSLAELQRYTTPRLADAMSQTPDVAGLIRQDMKGTNISQIGQAVPVAHTAASHAPGYPCHIRRQADGGLLIQACAPIHDDSGVQIGRDLVFFHAQPLLDQLQLHTRLGKENLIWLTDTAGRHILSNTAGEISVSTEIELSPLADTDSHDLVLFQPPLGEGQWQLHAAIPVSQLQQQLRELLFWPAIIILLLALAGALLANYLINPLLRKVRRQARELECFAQNQRQAASVFRHSSEAILITSPTNSIIEANPAFSSLTGYNAQLLVGKPLQDLLVKRDGLAKDIRKVLERLKKDDAWQGEIQYCCADGKELIALQTISTVRDEDGALVRYIHIFNDITAKKHAEEAVRHRALHDELTGLPNRTALESHLAQRLNRRRQDDSQAFAVLFLDLDHFKEVNDTLGHQAGDDLQRKVTERLQHRLRSEDMLARLGGDEFIIVLEPVQDPESAAQVASNMIAELVKPFTLDKQQAQIGVSIGIAIYPENGQDSQSLLEAADAAMYRAKDAGRNTWFFAGSTSNEQLSEE